MITKELIERINLLSKKQRVEGLTSEEQAEQTSIRRIYIDSIKEQVKKSLEHIEFVPDEEDENIHSKQCKCGHCQEH